ncbi:MAG: ankyrin repeat domain-containing protein [Gemmatimonas sp.]
MSDRQLPVHPNLRQLRRQAKDLLRAIHRREPDAVAELAKHHPAQPEPEVATLVDAQLALARSYGIASWPRLVLACEVTDAICHDRVKELRALIERHPALITESARGTATCNWGPPMSYAANLGRTTIIAMLRELGATDLDHAFDRACLQGELDAARQLHALGARPGAKALLGPAETLNPDGMGFLLEMGAPVGLAPVAMLLDGYSRNPKGKHACLELLVQKGIVLPDTAPMAVHRGRLDLLEALVRIDSGLLSQTFSLEEIYPRALGCHVESIHATPLAGSTLLHQCVDFDEMEIARWLLAQGMPPDIRAEIDADGFGGHTPLFGCVVAQSLRMRGSDDWAQLLLEHGADPNVRVSLRKRLLYIGDELMHEYRDVTPLSWGERFHEQGFVSRKAMRLIAQGGGVA